MQLIYLVLTGCCLIAALEDKDLDLQWLEYKQKFNKSFSRALIENENFLKFKENLQMISEHNNRYEKGEVSFEMGLNQFSDMDLKEVEAFSMGLRIEPSDAKNFNNNTNIFVASLADYPYSMDWRKYGAVTPVKNQGQCGSCWAFSAIAALESQHFLKTKQLIQLSEQNLVDCDTKKNNGCNGGWVATAYNYIRDNDGINTESSYPYKGSQNQCKFRKEDVGAKCNGYTSIAKGNENDLKAVVATQGPVAVGILATNNLRNYKSGVLNDNSCAGSVNHSVNHAVLVVGYGSENGDDYWLVKNSWGTRWGDQGYIKMARNKNNQCSIASHALIPNVKYL